MIYDQKVDLLFEDQTCATTRESRDKRTLAVLTCRAFQGLDLTSQVCQASVQSSYIHQTVESKYYLEI